MPERDAGMIEESQTCFYLLQPGFTHISTANPLHIPFYMITHNNTERNVAYGI